MLPNKKQSAFTGGELAPALWDRSDLAKHQIGAKSLKNCFVHVEGGASNRPGTKYVFNIGEKGVFVPFEFDDTQTVQLFFYDERVMFFSGGEVVVTNLVDSEDGLEWVESASTPGEYYFQAIGDASPGLLEPKALYEDGAEIPAGTLGALAAGEWAWGDNDSLGFNTIYVKTSGSVDPDSLDDGAIQIPVVVASPYALSDLKLLRWSQEYDTLVLTCKGYRQRDLVRYSFDDWRFEERETLGGPLGAINTDGTHRMDLVIENWRPDRNYVPGEKVRPATTANVTASWIGTVRSFEQNSTINGDLDTTALSSSDRYYASARYWGSSGWWYYYPFSFIQINKSSGLSAGDSISISITFSESGGASSYSASGIVGSIYEGTSYDYVSINLGWSYLMYGTYILWSSSDEGYSPLRSELPDDPDGLDYSPLGSDSEYTIRAVCFFLGTYSEQSNGGGASVSAVSGNVQKTSGGATAYESINPSVDIEPGVDTDWDLSWLALDSIPDEVINIEITASGHSPFTSDYVGCLIGMTEPDADGTISNQWASNVGVTQYSDWVMALGEVTMWTEGSWNGSVHLEQSSDGGTTIEEIASIHSEDQDHNGTLTREITEKGKLVRVKFEPGGSVTSTVKAYLRVDSSFTHLVEITHFHDSQRVIGRFVYGDAAPFNTTLWKFGAFGEPFGWPAVNAIFQERLMYANTDDLPKNIWGSRTGNYVNFATSDLQLATEPLGVPVSLSKQFEIRHLVPLKSLLILTAGSWHSLAGSDGGLTPTNGIITLHGYGGTSAHVSPLVKGLSVLCLQNDDRTISELRYSLASDGYDRTENLAVMAKHLFDGRTVNSWALQEDPHDLILVAMSDGSLACMTFLREQEVWAWAPWDTEGSFLEVGSVKSAPGSDDEVYFLTERMVDDETRYYIEFLSERLPDNDLEQSVFMDCSISYSGDAATIISGLEHLEGCAVAVLADGLVISGHTVENGQITLSTAASVVHVGLPYTARIQTLPLELGESMSSFGRRKAIRKAVVRVQNTTGFRMGPTVEDLTDVADWSDANYGLVSGEIDSPIVGDWDTSGELVIEQSAPLPMTVHAVAPFIELNE